uniref:Uncharacterized protein n=1 Tax=Lygus hesperus TaxID=30085 RepID=A0A146L1Z5_LYGHE
MLLKTRDILLSKGYKQIPQLTSSKPLDLYKPFSLFGPITVNEQQMQHQVPQHYQYQGSVNYLPPGPSYQVPYTQYQPSPNQVAYASPNPCPPCFAINQTNNTQMPRQNNYILTNNTASSNAYTSKIPMLPTSNTSTVTSNDPNSANFRY